MSNYNLSLAIEKEDLKYFYPGSSIVIAKPAEGEEPIVAWQVFRPFPSNTLSWEEQYGIYASTASIANGALLTRMSESDFPAVEKKLYVLEEDSVFSPPTEDKAGAAGSFYAENDYADLPILTFGLFQDATVNGQKTKGHSISAAPVLHKSRAQMTPHTTVYIWAESNVLSNSVVTNVTSPKSQVTFGEGVFDADLRYDHDSGLFIPEAGADVSVEGIAPTIF